MRNILPVAAGCSDACSADMERFGITVWGQTRELLWFAAVGVALGVWYELFRVYRLFGRHRAWRVFWQDIAAAVGAALITQLCALPISSGRVRLSHLLFLALGWVVYYLTVGRLIYGVLRRAARWVRRVFDAVGKRWKNFKRKCKKRQKTCKKHLQPTDDV